MDTTLVTTALELPGYRIVRNLGLVRGITVRSRSIVGKFGAALQTIVGGNISILTELCENSRAEAYEIMLAHAREVGATGIVTIVSAALMLAASSGQAQGTPHPGVVSPVPASARQMLLVVTPSWDTT